MSRYINFGTANYQHGCNIDLYRLLLLQVDLSLGFKGIELIFLALIELIFYGMGL